MKNLKRLSSSLVLHLCDQTYSYYYYNFSICIIYSFDGKAEFSEVIQIYANICIIIYAEKHFFQYLLMKEQHFFKYK